MTRLVFAHYFGGSARSWGPLVVELGNDFECVVPDLPGFGAAAPPIDLSLSGYVNAFATLTGNAPFIAIGHSMGGKIALALATRRPAEMIGLILLAASPPTPEPMSDEAREASLEAFGSHRVARRQLTGLGHRLPRDVLQCAIEDELRVAEPAWRWWLERGSRDDISPETDGLPLRTLVVTGDDDDVMGPDTASRIARSLGHAELRVIPDAGHLLPLERPSDVAALVRVFVAG